MSRRLVRAIVSADLLSQLLVNGSQLKAAVESDIPPGSTLRQISIDMQSYRLELIVEHESFGEVAEGNEIPLVSVVFHAE